MIIKTLRFLFYRVFVRTIVLLVLGLNVRHKDRLPKKGPAILVANHNSHLDTMVLVSLFPASLLSAIRPVAAMDYFMKNRWLAWFSIHIIGIIPIQRRPTKGAGQVLEPCFEALQQEKILILFPEGSRGEPEQLSTFKSGIAHLAKKYDQIPVIPVLLHGLGKSLPRGEALLVPFFCDVFVGEANYYAGDKQEFMSTLESRMHTLADEAGFPAWD